MPVVKIDYDKEKFDDQKMLELCKYLRTAIAESMTYDVEDVCVYATKNEIVVGTHPIEIYIQASTATFATEEGMQKVLSSVKQKIQKYKADHSLDIPFNVQVVRMDWKFEIGI